MLPRARGIAVFSPYHRPLLLFGKSKRTLRVQTWNPHENIRPLRLAALCAVRGACHARPSVLNHWMCSMT